ncbi:MM3350-like domain-containing protein [Mycena olivaceomarginata]|nr:MM3350-like domain-containing protein [Mycena olivaceomarginata]
MPPYTSSPESTKYRKEQEKLLRPRVINGRQTFVKFLPQDDLRAIHPVYLTGASFISQFFFCAGQADASGKILRISSPEDTDTVGATCWNGVLWSLISRFTFRWAQRIARHRIHDAWVAKCFYHGQLLPQVQTINALMEKKKAKIAAAQKELCDFVLVVRLRSTESASTTSCLTWRRIKVAGATKLSIFQDKILAPALGWTRNYHGYLLSTTAMALSLALPGPACVLGSLSFFLVVNNGFQHIDLGFLKDNGHTYLDDDQFTLADVLPGPNPDKPAFHYIYDLGDYWFHDIYVEKILSTSESDGKLTLLAGGGACPREDGQGFRNWSKYIQSLEPTKHAEITRAMNYRDDPAVLRLGSRWRFDPNAFDLTAALASPASVPSGPKKAVVPKGARRTVDLNAFLKDGLLNGAAFQTEVVRDKRDKRAGALCACCGKPITEPRMCAACRKVYYCDRSCQATHWKKEHKRLCAGTQRYRRLNRVVKFSLFRMGGAV